MQYEFLVKEINYGSITVEADNYAKAKVLADEQYHRGNTFWGNAEYELEPEDLPSADSLAGVTLDEIILNQTTGYSDLYFTAPVSLLQSRVGAVHYPDAIAADLNLWFNTEQTVFQCSISPVRETTGGLESYDWTDIVLTDEEIEFLFDLAGIHTKSN